MAIHELDGEQSYEREIAQCVGVTGYHHWFFLNALAEAHKASFRAYLVESRGVTLGVIPLLIRRRGPVSVVNNVPVVCTGPLLRGDAFRAGRVREVVAAAAPVLRRHRAVKTIWSFSPGLIRTSDQIAMPGFDVVETDNYVIPATRSADDCWKSMSQLRRRNIRACTSQSVFVEESSPEEITRWLPEQVSKGYMHQGAPASYTRSEAQSLTETLAGHPRMLWRSVKSADGSVLAISANIIGDERLENWLMVGPLLPKLSPHSMAYWDLINWALPKGLKIDFGGAPSEGVRKFKVSVGCEHETGYSHVKVRCKTIYEAARALHDWSVNR